MKYKNLRETELINRIADDFFGVFDCNTILSNIDFAVRWKATNVKSPLPPFKKGGDNTPSASVHPSTRGEYNVNASFYDIREHFQGRENCSADFQSAKKGRMKTISDDEIYNKLISDLRLEMIFLAKQIEPKIYEYGFLKE